MIYTDIYGMSGSESQGLVRAISLPMQQATARTQTPVFYKNKKPYGICTVRETSTRPSPQL